MNRIERISAILVRLQSRTLVTAREIAEQFGVSQRTIYRDIKALEESGVPICGEAGSGYSLVDGYKLPPLMFTTEEAISFLLAEKLVANLTEGDTYWQYTNGMNKIRAVLRNSEKNIIEDFDNFIRVEHDTEKLPDNGLNILQPLFTGILNKKCIKIKYKAGYNFQTTVRNTEPLGILFRDTNWYLLAWCRLRKDYRTFRLNRILSITLDDCPFMRQHADLDTVIRELYFQSPEYNISMRIRGTFLQFISNSKYLHGLYSEEADGNDYILKFRTRSPDFFARWFISFSDYAEVITPDEIVCKVKEILKGIFANNKI